MNYTKDYEYKRTNGFTSNEEIEVSADSGILDFSEQNPFGMP